MAFLPGWLLSVLYNLFFLYKMLSSVMPYRSLFWC